MTRQDEPTPQTRVTPTVAPEQDGAGQNVESSETADLDPEFEAALTAALALDATERLERLNHLVDELEKELG